MPQDELPKDLAALKRKLDEFHASVTAWEKRKLEELQAASAHSELAHLRDEIEMRTRDIATLTELAHLRGDEPNIDSLHQHLAKMQAELEEFQARHGLEPPQPKRWWQFWRT